MLQKIVKVKAHRKQFNLNQKHQAIALIQQQRLLFRPKVNALLLLVYDANVSVAAAAVNATAVRPHFFKSFFTCFYLPYMRRFFFLTSAHMRIFIFVLPPVFFCLCFARCGGFLFRSTRCASQRFSTLPFFMRSTRGVSRN